MTFRLEDRVVHDNEPGTVYVVNQRQETLDIRFDDGRTIEDVPMDEVIAVARIPVRVHFRFAIGERVRRRSGEGRPEYVVERSEKDDAEALYKLTDDTLALEDELYEAPLPQLSTDDADEIVATYLRDGVVELFNASERMELDAHRAKIQVTVESSTGDSGIKVTFNAMYNYGTPSAEAHTASAAIEECIRRAVADKINEKARLPLMR